MRTPIGLRTGHKSRRLHMQAALLFADVSGFTPLTKTLQELKGPVRGAEDLNRAPAVQTQSHGPCSLVMSDARATQAPQGPAMPPCPHVSTLPDGAQASSRATLRS